MIDLRSDTVTKPSKEMKTFMMDALLGDDVFQDDPTVKELEKKTRFLNHEVQNNKINHSQKLGHGGSFSQLSLK